MFQNIGLGEWAIIILFILVLFGSKKIPEFARNLRMGIEEFKKPVNKEEKKEVAGAPPCASPTATPEKTEPKT